ncbi:unnamed protein product [Closterium sp. NIES-65]|nr:unnamed protein product [Closterium sp. NIES-65]
MEQTSNARNHLLEESTDRCSLTPDSLTLLLISHPPPSIPQVFTNPRFLVLAFAMEQTSNARAHLLEAARLARLTGRVLVLPHVGSGRLSWSGSRLTSSSSSPAPPSPLHHLSASCVLKRLPSTGPASISVSLPFVPSLSPSFPPFLPHSLPFSLPLSLLTSSSSSPAPPYDPTLLLASCVLKRLPSTGPASTLVSVPPHSLSSHSLTSVSILSLLNLTNIGKYSLPTQPHSTISSASSGNFFPPSSLSYPSLPLSPSLPTTAGEVASGLGAILTYSLGHLPTRANTQVITVRKASRFLKAFQKWHDTDVVVWVKTTYKRMAIRPPTSLLAPVLLPYHPRWHTLARSISAALPRPFIALHFRSEYIAWLVGGKLQQEQKIGKQMHWCVAEAARTVHQTIDAASDASQKSSGFDTASTAEEVWPVRSESWGVMVEKYGREQTIDAGHRALLQLRALVDGDGDDYKGDGGIGAAPPPAASPTGGAPASRLRGGGAVPKPNAPSIASANSTVKPTGFKPTGPEPAGNKTNGGNPSGAGPKPTGTKPNSGSPSLTKPVENNKSTVNSTNKKSPAKPADKTADKTAAKPPGNTVPSAKKTVTVQSSAIESQRQRMVGARISAAGEAGSASWLVQNGGATCDISVGTWIPSSTRPAYASTCPYISRKFNCVQNGRPDGGYQHLMWQPRDCNMTLFSPLHFALMFQDKTLALVGDSNAEYLFQSLRCQLSTGLETESVNTTTAGAEAFRVISSNTLVLLVDAPFLSYAAPVAPRGISALVLLVGAPFLSYAAPVMPVSASAIPAYQLSFETSQKSRPSCPTLLLLCRTVPSLVSLSPPFQTLQFKSSAWNVHLDVLHPTLRQILPDAHAVIFSSGSWFMPPGRSYYKNGRPLAAQINGLQAHSAVLGVLSDYLAQLSPTGIQQLLLGLGKVVGAGAVGDVCWQVPGSAQTIAGYY